MDLAGTGPPLIELVNVSKSYPVRGGTLGADSRSVRALTDVVLSINAGESVGLVGESGCGKSTLARLVLLLEQPTAGRLRFRGVDYASLSTAQLLDFRSSVQAVFQDPFSSLSPRLRVGEIVAEPLRLTRMKAEERRSRAVEMLELVGLSEAAGDRYPHQFSGGQRQRIAIARALVSRPSLVVLDEPTSSLDVSIRAQVLNLLNRLRSELGVAFLAISHDLSMIRHLCDRVSVMYLGRVVETAENDQFYADPLHPYTRALLSSVLVPGGRRDSVREPSSVAGEPPSPVAPPEGCAFHPRCPERFEPCDVRIPDLSMEDDHRQVACHLFIRRPAT